MLVNKMETTHVVDVSRTDTVCVICRLMTIQPGVFSDIADSRLPVQPSRSGRSLFSQVTDNSLLDRPINGRIRIFVRQNTGDVFVAVQQKPHS